MAKRKDVCHAMQYTPCVCARRCQAYCKEEEKHAHTRAASVHTAVRGVDARCMQGAGPTEELTIECVVEPMPKVCCAGEPTGKEQVPNSQTHTQPQRGGEHVG